MVDHPVALGWEGREQRPPVTGKQAVSAQHKYDTNQTQRYWTRQWPTNWPRCTEKLSDTARICNVGIVRKSRKEWERNAWSRRSIWATLYLLFTDARKLEVLNRKFALVFRCGQSRLRPRQSFHWNWWSVACWIHQQAGPAPSQTACYRGPPLRLIRKFGWLNCPLFVREDYLDTREICACREQLHRILSGTQPCFTTPAAENRSRPNAAKSAPWRHPTPTTGRGVGWSPRQCCRNLAHCTGVSNVSPVLIRSKIRKRITDSRN